MLPLRYDPAWVENHARVARQRAAIMKASVTTVVQLINDFTGAGWPSSTSIACWWCCHPFSSPPLRMPERYDPRKKPPFVNSTGVLCSWSCMLSYSFSIKDGRTMMRAEAIHMLRARVDQIPLRNAKIRWAPPRMALQLFGGPLDITHFRNRLDTPMVHTEERADYDNTVCSRLERLVHVEHERVVFYRASPEVSVLTVQERPSNHPCIHLPNTLSRNHIT